MPLAADRGVGPKLKHDQSLTQAEISIARTLGPRRRRLRGDPMTRRRRPNSPRVEVFGPPDLILVPSEELSCTGLGPDYQP